MRMYLPHLIDQVVDFYTSYIVEKLPVLCLWYLL